MAEDLKDISIIIPFAEGDSTDFILQQVEGHGAELIVVSDKSRAKSMNEGAAGATRKFLWFLHVDTTLPKDAREKLLWSLAEDEKALHYFDLSFDSKGIMSWNANGANFRSHVLGLPFGDQAFCIRKDLFFKTGGYDENARYGEDHLLAWQAKRHGIKARSVGTTLITSARTYKGKWLLLTLKRQLMWISQSIPQLWKLMRGK